MRFSLGLLFLLFIFKPALALLKLDMEEEHGALRRRVKGALTKPSQHVLLRGLKNGSQADSCAETASYIEKSIDRFHPIKCLFAILHQQLMLPKKLFEGPWKVSLSLPHMQQAIFERDLRLSTSKRGVKFDVSPVQTTLHP